MTIKLIIWDFDNTLTNEHINKKKFGQAFEVLNDKNWPLLINQLAKNNIYVGIASFNYIDILLYYIEEWIPNNEIFNENNTRGNNGREGKKSILIKKIMEYYNIKNFDQVLFFDDNWSNILETRQLGINSYYIESGGFTLKDWNIVISLYPELKFRTFD